MWALSAGVALVACGDAKKTAPRVVREPGVQRPEQDLKGRLGYDLLCQASVRGDIDTLRRLIADGADVNSAYEEGKTPLVQAGYAGRTEAVRVLIEAGANVNHVSSNGLNILMHTAYGGDYVDAVRILLDAGADAKRHSRWGTNALGYAKHHGRTKIVNLLKERGVEE